MNNISEILGFVYYFNGISIPLGLFNADIWFIFKCLITIITILSMFHFILFFNFVLLIYLSIISCLHCYGIKYSYQIQIICIQLFDIKYSYLIQRVFWQLFDIEYSYLIQIVFSVIWYQVFLSNTNVVFWPSTRENMPFQSNSPEGSDISQWPVIERNRVGGNWLTKWDKVKNPMIHS